MEDGTSGAVLDHEEAERERAEAERVAEEEALEAAGLSDETPEPGGAPNPEPSDPPADEPGDGEESPEAAIGEVALDLPGGQLSFTGIGGKKPTSATVRLTGGRVDLPVGQLEKGTDIVLRVVARVVGVGFEDELDAATKLPIGCERRHKARIINVGLLAE